MAIRLVHYMADQGEGEYIALLDKSETVREFCAGGYSVSGVFTLVPLTESDDEFSLPTGRTFVED